MASSFEVRNEINAVLSARSGAVVTPVMLGHVEGDPALIVKDWDGAEHTVIFREREDKEEGS